MEFEVHMFLLEMRFYRFYLLSYSLSLSLFQKDLSVLYEIISVAESDKVLGLDSDLRV